MDSAYFCSCSQLPRQAPQNSNCLLPPVVLSSCCWRTQMQAQPATNDLSTLTEWIQEASHPYPHKNVICISCLQYSSSELKGLLGISPQINLHGHVISSHRIIFYRLLKMNLNWWWNEKLFTGPLWNLIIISTEKKAADAVGWKEDSWI